MSDQASLFTSSREQRAEAMAEAHRQGKFYVEPGVTLPPRQGATLAHHRARTADPHSSKAAAEEVTDTGRADREAAQVLAALRISPGTTSRELAEFSGLDYHTIARRLPELRDKQFLVTAAGSRPNAERCPGERAMELPDRIEAMTKEQLMHLVMLVDQLDEAYPIDRTAEERLAKDPHLAILPSGRKLTTHGVRDFEIVSEERLKRMSDGWLPPGFEPGIALVTYCHGGEAYISDPHDIAAFNSALNDIGVYVAVPTLKGDDGDGDGEIGEHHLTAILGSPV